MIRFETSLGVFTVELDAEAAPVSSENFQRYVDDGHFDGTVFHRVIPGFMIQGGGFAPDMTQKPTRRPIENEAGNGLRNRRGSLAMARTNEINSASSQFFVNLVDNNFLDHRPGNFGYAVFGRVVDGMDVIDRIAAVKTGRRLGHDDVPLEPVVVTAARRVDAT
ncbi:MAG: peptidylprolyl isomerase [Steroidobacteraceae bacterium]